MGNEDFDTAWNMASSCHDKIYLNSRKELMSLSCGSLQKTFRVSLPWKHKGLNRPRHFLIPVTGASKANKSPGISNRRGSSCSVCVLWL